MNLLLKDNQVYLASTAPTYKEGCRAAIRSLFEQAGLDLRASLPASSRIVLKPNWVHHCNASGAGLDCLITHPSLIEALLEMLPPGVQIGDAPVQGCDFEKLRQYLNLSHPILDFRLAIREAGPWHHSRTSARSEKDYVRFNLGSASHLEAVSNQNSNFRVTMYDPKALESTHSPGNHQYLIARELLEADLVVNLPKLKTHKKAGITGALKNMVGANGHKSFLPHHRKGSAENGGDCYPEHNEISSIVEDLLDAANGSHNPLAKQFLGRAASATIRAGKVLHPNLDIEGSWHGNDTVWRMVLDLQSILCFGDTAGKLHSTPQRKILNITDAIIAGQGEGPLAPQAAPLGLLTMGTSAAACDWVHALLMGFDPQRIPLTKFSAQPQNIEVFSAGRVYSPLEAAKQFGQHLQPPQGWRGHCELQ